MPAEQWAIWAFTCVALLDLTLTAGWLNPPHRRGHVPRVPAPRSCPRPPPPPPGRRLPPR